MAGTKLLSAIGKSNQINNGVQKHTYHTLDRAVKTHAKLKAKVAKKAKLGAKEKVKAIY